MTDKKLSQAEENLAGTLIKVVTDLISEILSGTIMNQISHGQLEYLRYQCQELERRAKRILE